MTAWYFFFQASYEDKFFKVASSDQRAAVVKTKRPPFTTVLDLDDAFEDEGSMNAEQIAKVHYRGPFYIDLDSDDPEEVLANFKLLLKKLQEEFNVDLKQLELYATGGRGYHILFHPHMFQTKVPARGQPALPYIYREMAQDLYVDNLDMNIYSAKRGRMFREKNVQRDNGLYKVQLTVDEALNMTVEMYKHLCSAPRHLQTPEEKPVYNVDLGMLFTKAHAKVDASLKRRKNAKNDQKLLDSFGGKIPPTILSMMAGENLDHGKGFQKIATQLAITAHAMDMTEQTFIEACQGLIQNHRGDGSRYGSPPKRRRELIRMFHYMDGNPCYTFGVGAIKSVLAEGTQALDLDMGSEAPEVDEFGNSEMTADETNQQLSQGVRVTSGGVFRKTEEGLVKVCQMGIDNIRQLVDLHSGEINGYEVDVMIDGTTKSRSLGMDAFLSRTAFNKFTLSAGSCNINLTDGQIGALADIFRVRAMTNNQQVYNVRREGIDLVVTPSGDKDIIWADQYGVTSNFGMNYRLTGSLTEDLQFRTDLRNAPELSDSPEAREFFHSLFQINKTEVVARIFGFMLASFLSQPIRHIFNKFPLLQIYGPAGSGKSDTVKLLARMHYYLQDPLVSSALDSTRFLYEEMATCSGSIPFILDEYKPREMHKNLLEKSKGILRSNYNGDAIGKGAVNSSTGASKLVINRVSNRSPIVVMGEAIISQTAILDRCVAVPVTKDGKKDRRDVFLHCQANRQFLSMLGRTCIDTALGLPLKVLQDQVERHMTMVREQVGSKADDNDRPLFNLAVVLTGLEFGRRIMRQVFGDEFEKEFLTMKSALTETSEDLIPKVVSEVAKVLDTIGYLTTVDNEHCNLLEGREYVVAGQSLFLKLKDCYYRYARFKRMMGEEVLYDDFAAFYNALSTYPGTLDTKCIESPLKDSSTTAVFEMSVAYMLKDHIETFKSK
jgi:hypothetical protein